ncbi:MAG: hypothetical protein RIM72_22675 [Alphaproteobacteria bacterium]
MRKTIALALAAIGFVAFTASAQAGGGCAGMTTAKTKTTTTVATTGGQTSIPNTGS